MEHLQALAQQVERQRKLRTMEQSLSQQLRQLEEKAWNLKYDWTKEENDVEKLNKTSLTGLFYELLGKKEEKLEQEKREALAAAAKYQAAQAELDGVRRELETVREELGTLFGCESRYEQAKQERAQRLKTEDTAVGQRIVALEAELAGLNAQRQELKEAMDAGMRALSTARGVQKELDSAENWGTWDMIGGGGLISAMAKHDHLDGAQEMVNHLQQQLRHFKTELADVELHLNLQVQIDGFLRFADWFFDGLIVDWTVQSKIRSAQDQVYRVVCEIQRLLDRLGGMEAELDRREDKARGELEALVLA